MVGREALSVEASVEASTLGVCQDPAQIEYGEGGPVCPKRLTGDDDTQIPFYGYSSLASRRLSMSTWIWLSALLVALAAIALVTGLVIAMIRGVLTMIRMKKEGTWQNWSQGLRPLVKRSWLSLRVRIFAFSSWCIVSIPLVFLAQTLNLFEQPVLVERIASFLFLALPYVVFAYAIMYKFGPRFEPISLNAKLRTSRGLYAKGEFSFDVSIPQREGCEVEVPGLESESAYSITLSSPGAMIPLGIDLQPADASLLERLGNAAIKRIVVEPTKDTVIYSDQDETTLGGLARLNLISTRYDELLITDFHDARADGKRSAVDVFSGAALFDRRRGNLEREAHTPSLIVDVRDGGELGIFTTQEVVHTSMPNETVLSVRCLDRIVARIEGRAWVKTKFVRGSFTCFSSAVKDPMAASLAIYEPQGEIHFDSCVEDLGGIDNLDMKCLDLEFSLENVGREIGIQIKCETDHVTLVKSREGRVIRKRDLLRDLKHSKLGGLIRYLGVVKP